MTMEVQQLKQKLNELIKISDKIEPYLARRLKDIQQSIKTIRDGELVSKKYLRKGLEEIIIDAEFWLCYCLASQQEKQVIISLLSPLETFWYSTVFPNWCKKEDKYFDVWKKHLLKNQLPHNDAHLIGEIGRKIYQGKRQGKESKFNNASLLSKLIADKGMATDLIATSSKAQPLSVQLTQSNLQKTSDKIKRWEEILKYWDLKRGLFASYNPCTSGYINWLVDRILSGCDNIKQGEYSKKHLK